MKYTDKDLHKDRFPISTAAQSRYILWNGGLKNSEADKELNTFSNKYGIVTVKNHCLTQHHRNILDAILAHYAPTKEHSDGSIEFEFSLYGLQKILNPKGSATNHKHIREKFDEMQSVQLEMITYEGRRKVFSILNEHDGNAEDGDATILKPTTGKGKTGKDLHVIQLNRNYVKFFEQDTNLRYHALLPFIFELSKHWTQAFVRYVISHQYKNENINGVLETIGLHTGRFSSQVVSNNKRTILNSEEVLKENFGIIFDYSKSKRNPVVRYSQHELVFTENPKSYDSQNWYGHAKFNNKQPDLLDMIEDAEYSE